MNYFSKTKVIQWGLVFLVIVLLSALISVLIFFNSDSGVLNATQPGNTERRINQELNLTAAQSNKVETVLSEYRTATEPTRMTIRSHRVQLLEELASGNPDTILINMHLNEICNLQKEMQKAAVKQYMALKNICTPFQCERLSSLYFELYGFQGQGKGKGMGNGKGKMHQYRRGQGQQRDRNQEAH
jgi:Spy/CpxP family protein refolding chaperone